VDVKVCLKEMHDLVLYKVKEFPQVLAMSILSCFVAGHCLVDFVGLGANKIWSNFMHRGFTGRTFT
jgi:hypothetical protein